MELTVAILVMRWLQRTQRNPKQEYLKLLSNARRNGWEVKYTTIEIGALGHYQPVVSVEMATNCESIPLPKWREILLKAATIAINCSQTIFLVGILLSGPPTGHS